MAEGALIYFREKIEYDPKAAQKFLTPDMAELFTILIERLGGLQDFSHAGLEAAFNSILEEKGIKLGKLAQPVRVALTGGTVSPGIFEMIEAMGRDVALKRLADGLEYISIAQSPMA